MGRTTSTLRKAAKQLLLAACRSLSLLHPIPMSSRGSRAIIKQDHHEETIDKSDSFSNANPTFTEILCAICLEPLSHRVDTYPYEAMFTGQCSHSFHFSCIASNVRHGSVTCPVCRAYWTHLPCTSSPKLFGRQLADSVFRIRDDSIATFRARRRYDDDDPIDPPHSTTYPRLAFSLIPLTVLPQPEDCHCLCTSLGKRNAYLSVRLTNLQLQPIDLVLVASPSGPHLRFLKQAMILVTLSLRPVDRLAIVTYSCVAARVFALRRMTSCGKRAALRVIDRLFYMGQTDPSQGIVKGMKVLKDRAYKNPQCSILHISSSPIRSSYYSNSVMQMGFMVHVFHLGFGTETWNGFVLHKLEELIEKVLVGVASDIQLRIGMEERIVKVGELRGGEERQMLLDLGVHVNVRLCYSYVEGDSDECIRIRGETTLSFDEKEGIKTEAACGWDDDDYMNTTSVRGSISTESWDYHNPFMGRRWARRLHGTVNL